MCVIAVRCRTSNVTFPTRGPVDNHATPIVSIRFTSDLGDAPSSTPVVTITMSKCGILWLVGIMNAFFYVAISHIPLGTAVTIEFIGPLVLSTVLSHSIRDVLWVGLAMVGVGLFGVERLLRLSSLRPIGVVCALGAGLFWALYILAADNAGKKVTGTGVIAIVLLIGSLPSTPLGMANLFMVATDAHLLLLAIGTAILASLVPYTLEFLALRRLPPSTFGILLSMEPAVAATAGWLLLNQHMGVLGMLAVCLVVSACVGTATSKS